MCADRRTNTPTRAVSPPCSPCASVPFAQGARDHGPAGEREAESFLRRDEQSGRVVDDGGAGEPLDLPHPIFCQMRQGGSSPSSSGILAQVRAALEHAMTLDELGRADGHDPVIEQLLAVQIRVISAPETDADVHGGAREVHQLARGVEAQLDLGMLAAKRAYARQQPVLQ